MKDKVILVLEDEVPLLNAIKKKLESFGFKVVGGRSVEQGLDYLEELDHVDAIWLDHYLLGKANGLDFVTKLKDKNSSWKEVPIFVVSNTATSNKIQSYIKLGIDKYYTKADNRLEDIILELKNTLN